MPEPAEVAAPKRGRGRPRGSTGQARARIVDAARTAFARTGFTGTSLRAIAREAGVDPALLHHYFDSKEQLFLETVDLPLNPADVLAEALAEVTEGSLGEAMLRRMIPLWDLPEVRRVMTVMLRSIPDSPDHGRMTQEFIRTRIAPVAMHHPLARIPEGEEDRAFMQLHSLLFGIAYDRLLACTPPLADASADEIARAFGPLLDLILGCEVPDRSSA